MRTVIRERLSEAPTIPQLARLVGLNQQKLKIGFRELFGQTILQYTLDQRMLRAVALLRQGLPIKVVAVRVGYSCSASFSRAFEGYCGVRPMVLLRSANVVPLAAARGRLNEWQAHSVRAQQ